MSGEIDISMTDSLRDNVERALRESGLYNLVFDFSRVSFIDSAGLGVVLGRYKRLSAAGGSVYLAGAGSQVSKVLELSGLLTLMENYPTVDAVLQQIS